MTSHYTSINAEVHNYMNVEVPQCLKSDSSAQCIKARNRVYQLASTSSTQNSGGLILFQIPASSYCTSRGTLAMRCRITVTGTGLASGAAASAVGFSGPGSISSTTFVPSFGSGYAFLNRISVFGANSAVIDQTNFSNDFSNLTLIHNSNPNYLVGDSAMLTGIGMPWYYSSTTSAQIDLVLPLPISIFNGTQNWPNFLLSAPMTIQLDLASAARALFHGSTATITDYQISNAYLIYQAIELPADYVNAERSLVKTHPFIMSAMSSLNVQVPASVLSSYTLGLNASSTRACFVMPSNTTTYSNGTQLQYTRDTVDTTTGYNGAGTNALIFLDGNQVLSSIQDTPAMCFAMLKQALHHNLQASVIYSSPAMNTGATLSVNPYLTNFYALGFDLSNFDEEQGLLQGSPCTSVNLQLTGYNNSGANNLNTIIILYDVIAAISADGTIEIRR
jgi:hypothetical protein